VPTYTIQSPDGRKITIQAADEATAMRGAQEWARSNPKAAPKAPSAQERANTDAQRRVSSTPAQVRAFTKGASFGFADELDALGAGAETGINNALSKITGGKGAGYTARDAYRAVMDANEQQDAKFAREHPVQNVGLQVAGGLAAPGAAAAAKYVGKSASLGQAALRSARVGAVVGGITGAGNNRGEKRLTGGIEGAGIGGALGGAVPYVARGAQVAGNALKGAVSETADQVRLGLGQDLAEPSARQMERSAKNALGYVQGLANRAEKTSPNALSANPIEAAGKPITAAEAIGRPGVTDLSVIGRRAGKTGDALESTLRQRQTNLPSRVLSDLEEVTGVSPEAIAGDYVAHAKALRAKATPLYDAAYAEQAVDSPKLDALYKRPSMRAAMRRAVSIAQEEGRDPTALGLQTPVGPGKPTTAYETQTLTKRGSLGEPIEIKQQVPVQREVAPEPFFVRRPTVQTHDYVKRGLDDLLETYRDKTTGRLVLDEKGRAILNTLNEYRGLVAPEGSTYRAALDAGGEPIRLEESFRNAQKLMKSNIPMRSFEVRYDKLTPSEQEAHIAGFVNDAFEAAQTGKLRLKDIQQPLYGQKLAKMLGPEKAQAFLGKIEQEASLARTGGRMMPNNGSPSMELLAANSDQEGAIRDLASAAGSAFQGKPLQAALKIIASPVMGGYRGARMPLDRATRDEVGRLLQLPPSELNKLLRDAGLKPLAASVPDTARTSNALAQISGSQANQ